MCKKSMHLLRNAFNFFVKNYRTFFLHSESSSSKLLPYLAAPLKPKFGPQNIDQNPEIFAPPHLI